MKFTTVVATALLAATAFAGHSSSDSSDSSDSDDGCCVNHDELAQQAADTACFIKYQYHGLYSHPTLPRFAHAAVEGDYTGCECYDNKNGDFHPVLDMEWGPCPDRAQQASFNNACWMIFLHGVVLDHTQLPYLHHGSYADPIGDPTICKCYDFGTDDGSFVACDAPGAVINPPATP